MACICVAPAICVSLSGATMCVRVCVCFRVTPRCHFLQSSLQLPWLCFEAITVCQCVCVIFSKHSVFTHARVLFVWPRMFQSAPLPVSRCHAVNLSTHLTSQPAPSGPSARRGRPTLWSFHSLSCFSYTPQWLESLTDASVLSLLLYSLSVSTCHWALCLISSGGEQNEGY